MGYRRILYKSWLIRRGRLFANQSSFGKESTRSRSGGSSSQANSSKINSFSSSSNHYEVLGVLKNCSQKQVRDAYIARSKEYHPDCENKMGLSEEELKSKFQQVYEAYSVLNNPDARKDYDSALERPNYENYGSFHRQRSADFPGFYHRSFDPYWRQREQFYREQRKTYNPIPNGVIRLIIMIMVISLFIETTNFFLGLMAISRRVPKQHDPYDHFLTQREYAMLMQRDYDEAHRKIPFDSSGEPERRPLSNKIIFSIASELSSRRHLENLGLHPSLNTLMQIDQLYHMLYAGKYLQSKFVTRQVKLITLVIFAFLFSPNFTLPVDQKDYQEFTDSLRSLVELQRKLLNFSGLGLVRDDSHRAIVKVIEADLLRRMNLTSDSNYYYDSKEDLLVASSVDPEQFKKMYIDYVDLVKSFFQEFERTERLRAKLYSL